MSTSPANDLWRRRAGLSRGAGPEAGKNGGMLSKADADVVRSQNRRLIIDHFRRWPVSTRRRMSEATGLSLSSTSSIASDMARLGILRESLTDAAGEAPARRGRPEVSLTLCGGLASIAALKITVGAISLSLVDYAGRVLATVQRELDLSVLSEPELVGAVLALLAADGARLPGGAGPLLQVVVSVQGVTDASDRRIVWSPILGIRGVDLATPIEAATGARTRVLNDCSLMPERFRWAGEVAAGDFATLFIGFGVGMGLRLSGRTFRGAQSSAVEFGHLNHIPAGDLCRCGNRGCVEAYAGDYAIWRAAKGATPGLFERRITDSDMKGLAAAARDGEAAALRAFERAGQAIGYGLGRMFTLIDPLPIVFVGSGAEAMDILEPAIRRGIGESAIDGVGADVPFQVMPDVDRVTVEAATTLALAALDEDFSRASNIRAEADQDTNVTEAA